MDRSSGKDAGRKCRLHDTDIWCSPPLLSMSDNRAPQSEDLQSCGLRSRSGFCTQELHNSGKTLNL